VAKKLYKADRDFDDFQAGEVYELDEDNPYIRTGYLDEFNPEGDSAPAAEEPPALAETTVAPVTDGPAPSDEFTDAGEAPPQDEAGGEDGGAAEAEEAGAGPKSRSRGRK
jgi:hypothetical protein